MSDHFPTCLVHNVSGPKSGQHISIKYRSFKDFDQTKMNDDIEKLPWSVLDTFDDPDDALDTFISLIEGVLNDHIPWREKRVKRVTQPQWMSNDILEAIDTRDKYVRQKDHANYKLW